MREDEESYIRSQISYNLFDFLDKKGAIYGYRQDTYDYPGNVIGFAEACAAYCRAKDIQPTQLLSKCDPPTWAGLNTDSWTRHGYYNNFFVSRVDFWMQSQVQDFLQYMDRIGGGFLFRWSDLPTQSAAVQIFLEESQVYKFEDWTYQHVTIGRDHSMGWGGVSIGANDPNGTAVADEFVAAHGALLHEVW